MHSVAYPVIQMSVIFLYCMAIDTHTPKLFHLLVALLFWYSIRNIMAILRWCPP